MRYWIEHSAVWAVRAVSAFFRALGWRACRFEPTCSHYSEQAFSRFGFFKGIRLTIVRFLRCSPLTQGGFDPLPDRHPEATKSPKDLDSSSAFGGLRMTDPRGSQ